MKVTVWTIFFGFSNGTKPNKRNSERINSELLRALVPVHLHDVGATILPSVGFYRGTSEAGASVVVIDDGTAKNIRNKVLGLAGHYREIASQHEVWITEETKVLHKIKN
jgi:hypothetical protein